MSADQPDPLPVLEVHADAASEISDQGGRLYVWADGAGMKHVRYHPSEKVAEIEWMQLTADGIQVFVDPGIRPPAKWVIALRHIPHRHVAALYNGFVPGASGFGMTVPENI
jgi:hypothetical protein